MEVAPPSPKSEPPVEVAPSPPPTPDPALLSELGRLREENATLQGRVAEMAVTMARLRRDVLEASEPDLVQLAISIAERVVGRELASDPQLIVSWAREAIQALASKNEVVIALAKDLLSQVPTEAWEGVGFAHAIQADLELAAGTIEVRAPGAVVGAGAQARLDSVAQALGVGERQGQS